MITAIRNRFVNFFINGHERTLTAKKNIAMSFLVKGGSILISLSLVPLTINYVTPAQYGIWLTISSIIGWLNFFDIGLGNGLRNNLAYSLATGKIDEAKSYISTTYVALAVVSSLLFCLLFIINPFVNWHLVLNIPVNELTNIQAITLIVIGCFCIQFVVQTITIVLTATHQSAKASLISLLSQFVVLIIIFILSRHQTGSLLTLVTVLAGVPLLTLLVATIYLYRHSLNYIAPTLKKVDLKMAKGLLKTGGVFFAIQIGALVLFQTDNIIITQVLGPAHVTTFNISYKLFSVITMGFTIIVTPLWSAFTDAYAKKDFEWINACLQRMKKIWLGFTIATVCLLFLSPQIYTIWIGTRIPVPISLSVAMAVYVVAYTWQTMHVFLLNGTGKVRLQLILVTLSALLNIPLAIFLGKLYGLPGIISANTIFFIGMGITFSIQCSLITKQTATKIWAQ
ncbi:lipopolysaccharide biosynthesis protein [Spirosoma jeollabukense]